ncbi:thiamine ABC transporter substrate-binding protein [Nocardioides terrisoli]|uniref:thiamine ABC transporter substrate-binding protein n=1 Tax=Nocardioides terrisoli TaxID=3388267 RepID=UPI00287B7F1D|nr:thiamine ABC transporter substrate-binding protein [Nocardioides marmorisolisilvae]
MRSSRPFHVLAGLLALGVATTGLAGCGSSSGSTDSHTIVVATHDSWAMPKQVIADFEKQSGYTVKIEEQGDAGELTNKLVLTKDSPIADAVYGIDNTFASRAVDAGVLDPYTPKSLPASAKRYLLPGSGAHDLTPVDYGDVCVNVDDVWFRQHHLAEPRTLDDLTKPAYKNLFVTPAATTSSPGLAFLAATIAAKGDHWQSYWKALLANGTKIDSGWDQAWNADYTAGGGKGTRPIVLSYSSSPPDTIPKGATRPTTSALLDTCFRQVEYAGVVRGADNPRGARAFVDFMLSRPAQRSMPESMYVYPVDKSVPLPAQWAKWATVSPKPWVISPSEITQKRAQWLREWRDLVSG